jgi:uncharacterized membrane protein
MDGSKAFKVVPFMVVINGCLDGTHHQYHGLIIHLYGLG